VQEASGDPSRAADAQFPNPVSRVGSPPDSRVVRRCGRFSLTRSADGLRWVLTSRAGSVWHWHAEGRQWIASCHAYRTEAEATAGLEQILAHEEAGDLDEQLAAPRARHGPNLGRE
jgi:hypothetical protein